MANRPLYGEVNSDLDLDEMRGRRPSEDTLIARSHDASPGHGDRGLNEASPGLLDYFSSSKFASPHRFGVIPRIRHILAQTALFLLPSFISSRFAEPVPKKTLSPTAWLDGLRGIACVCVVLHHYTYAYSKTLDRAYDGVKNTGFLQLPIIKLVHHGPPMVKIFYIISGFALTVKAVKITRVPGKTFDAAGLMSNLSVSIWKRYLRLFIPCVASVLLGAFMAWLGMFEVVPYETHPKWVTGLLERRAPPKDSIFQQLAWAFWDFYAFGVEVTFFGANDKIYSNDVHLWTIPVEFRTSIQLFVIVAGGCTLHRWLRVYILCPIISVFLLFNNRWELSLFIFGYFLAELYSDLIANSSSASSLPTANADEKQTPRSSLLKNILRGIMIFAGLWLASFPLIMSTEIVKDTTGFGFLVPLTPAKYPIATSQKRRWDHAHDFWQTVGAMLIAWALMYMPKAQNLVLCNGPVQYLGKISFALYVMHGHVHRSIGYWLVKRGLIFTGIWHWNSQKHDWELLSGHDQLHNSVLIIAFFIDLAITICWADIFWRGVDMQSVRFLRWLETKLKR